MTPNLSEQFLAPKGWRTHGFVNNETGHKIHYGSVFPQTDTPPHAVIVCLGGLSEFSEKYFELAHDMLERNYAFWFMDWAYQGRSSRLENMPHRRHSDGFDADVSDLYKLVADYIKPSSVHPDKGRIPLIMVAHSMGANIGLQFLAKHPKYFDGAAFTAPFLGIHKFNVGLKLLSILIRPLMPFISKKYVFGGKDWHEDARKSDGTDIFSHDPMRDKIHNEWVKADPVLQVGNPTFGWVIKALRACSMLIKKSTLEKIKIPVLVVFAGQDVIVDNKVAKNALSHLPKGKMLDINGANHEILMEKDEYRDIFLNEFDKMVKENKIATLENLKPF